MAGERSSAIPDTPLIGQPTARGESLVLSDLEYRSTIAKLNAERAAASLSLVDDSPTPDVVVLSTRDGIVFDLSVDLSASFTIGEKLMFITPVNHYIVGVAFIPESAIDYVQAGETVGVRFRDFPYQRYDDFCAKVLSLSTSATETPSDETGLAGVGAMRYRMLLKFSTNAHLPRPCALPSSEAAHHG